MDSRFNIHDEVLRTYLASLEPNDDKIRSFSKKPTRAVRWNLLKTNVLAPFLFVELSESWNTSAISLPAMTEWHPVLQQSERSDIIVSQFLPSSFHCSGSGSELLGQRSNNGSEQVESKTCEVYRAHQAFSSQLVDGRHA